MIDPKRWLEEGGGATFEERDLLRAGREARLPDALRKRVWVGVATGVTAIETAAAAGTALQNGVAAKGAFTLLSSTAIKGLAALALAGGVGLGVTSLSAPHEARSGANVTSVAPTIAGESAVSRNATKEAPSFAELPRAPELPDPEPQSAASAETGALLGGKETKLRASHPPRSSHRPSSPAAARTVDSEPPAVESGQEGRRASRLAEESAAVVAIRKTLLAGEPAEALRMLDRASAHFSDGILGQEREALAVRALVESGQKDAARRRGEAFLRVFPRSPHAAELQALLAR